MRAHPTVVVPVPAPVVVPVAVIAPAVVVPVAMIALAVIVSVAAVAARALRRISLSVPSPLARRRHLTMVGAVMLDKGSGEGKGEGSVARHSYSSRRRL